MFDKKYNERKKEYFLSLIDFAEKLGWNYPELSVNEGRLCLVNLEEGKKTFLINISVPSKKDCLNKKKFNYHLELAKESLMEAFRENND